jgi:hypothetical protein
MVGPSLAFPIRDPRIALGVAMLAVTISILGIAALLP